MKKTLTSLHMVGIYAGILLIAVLLTSVLRPTHISDRPQPTEKERLEQAAEDSTKFRAIRRAQAGESDYAIPDSTIKK